MTFSHINIPILILSVLAWITMGVLFFQIYKRQIEKPKVWKAILVVIIGIFSFSINWPMLNQVIKIPILPLGVWLLYFIYRKSVDKWLVYRKYAWLGFFSGYLFLATSLLSLPVNHLFYPKDQLETYLANMENAHMIILHPSGVESSLNKEKLEQSIGQMEPSTIYSDEWYSETYMDPDEKNKSERFPYQLVGVNPKIGSGMVSTVYVERDGKGLLISTPNGQQYFRSKMPFLEGLKEEKRDE
ncbi:hypothetical protein SM124_07340 [Bacillus sp. 31A1R]|uniref:Uncharacterized protein n=1 Tax=Robertmurraya mangrovi TaxID=3098077 RepID=A0ABU5IWM1_9BACI|nr:hypothetical protein [Bacillus sp. 31A1R]MDZ5471559.1 hypothetical protein [Bacillus sp. 31A1R]